MSNEKLQKLVEILTEDNFGSRDWVHRLQHALYDLDPEKYRANYDYCQSKGYGDSDGRWGKRARADLTACLEDYDELQTFLGDKLKGYLEHHGWTPTHTDQTQPEATTQAVIGPQQTYIPTPIYTQHNSFAKATALSRMGNYIAKAEHYSDDIANGRIYDIKNGQKHPWISSRGARVPATECTFAEISTSAGSHGKFQINRNTFPDYLRKGTFKYDYMCRELGVNSPEEIKALPYNINTQEVMGNALVEEKGFSKMLTGAYTPQKFLRRIANRWAGLPKDSNGGRYDHDESGNHHTVGYTESIRQLELIRDEFIENSLTHDLAQIGVDLKKYIDCSASADIVNNPDLLRVFNDNPDAILALSPESRAALINMGLRDELQDIVNDHPHIRKSLQREATELAAGNDLTTIAKDEARLTALQANWALQGTYTAKVDGDNGPSTRGAYAAQRRIEKINEQNELFEQNKGSISLSSTYTPNNALGNTLNHSPQHNC